MAFIVRGIKAGSGTTAWVDGIGKIILAVEANLDIDQAYAIINGGLENDNIKDGAGVVYSKLNLAGGIINADVAAGANLDGAKFLTASVPGAKLVDLGVTTAKIANGAVSNGTSALASNALVLATIGAWTDIATPQVAGLVLASAPASGLLMQFSGFAFPSWTAGTFDNGFRMGLMFRLVTRTGGVDTVRAAFQVDHIDGFDNANDPLAHPVPFSVSIIVTGLPAATYDFKTQYYLYRVGVTAPVYTLSPAMASAPVAPERHLVVVPLFK